MFHKSKLCFGPVKSLLLTIIFFIWRQMGRYDYAQLVSVINTILIPFVMGGFLYYITNPLVTLLEKKLKINRIFGILITLFLLFGLVTVGVIYLLPILINQLSSLINSTQNLYWEFRVLSINYPKIPCLRV